MAQSFQLEILTPGKKLLATEVSEVVLPAYDGERGVLAGHENFVGLLGTGALKLVRDGNDYWYMVSSGIYEVKGGTVSVLAEVAQEADEIDPAAAQALLPELEKKLAGLSTYELDYKLIKMRCERAQAQIAVHRRTTLLN